MIIKKCFMVVTDMDMSQLRQSLRHLVGRSDEWPRRLR
jgi:hypothetical protein